MSARRKTKPAGPLPDNWNVIAFPSGDGVTLKDRNRRIRLAWLELDRAYCRFANAVQPLENRTLSSCAGIIGDTRDWIWNALIEAGAIR